MNHQSRHNFLLLSNFVFTFCLLVLVLTCLEENAVLECTLTFAHITQRQSVGSHIRQLYHNSHAPTMMSPVRITGIRSLSFHSQRRSISLTSASTSGSTIATTGQSLQLQQEQLQDDINHAIETVQDHDPSGYLPGRLLPEKKMRTAYYAVRSFWIETGLRFGSTAAVPPNATPAEHLQWWQQGLDHYLFLSQNYDKDVSLVSPSDNVTLDNEKKIDIDSFEKHPTFRLLQSLMQDTDWPKQHFDDILKGRRKDLDVKQYDTLQDLVKHAGQSCGSLSQLVLESGQICKTDHPVSHEAARLLGIGHGLTNALRTSIPVISTTGKLVVPADLCVKYGVRSPRYLLSALGMGDQVCVQALQSAVEDIATTAREHLTAARDLRAEILLEPQGKKAVSVLLPGLASDSFLNRLEKSQYQLTDRNLRNVGRLEHAVCAGRMIAAYYQQTY
jgi:phytoene/squalene synthetase